LRWPPAQPASLCFARRWCRRPFFERPRMNIVRSVCDPGLTALISSLNAWRGPPRRPMFPSATRAVPKRNLSLQHHAQRLPAVIAPALKVRQVLAVPSTRAGSGRLNVMTRPESACSSPSHPHSSRDEALSRLAPPARPGTNPLPSPGVARSCTRNDDVPRHFHSSPFDVGVSV